MNKTKILIQIFPLVKDIDYLERTLLLLRQNSKFIDSEKYYVILDVTLPIGDYLTDWGNSVLKQDYFINKFNHFKKYGDWCAESNFNLDYEVKGILDCFTKNLRKYPDVDNVILLETDIIFNQYTLNLLLDSAEEVKKQTNEYIITPEHTKLWDDSWDIVVNSKFINKPQNYRDIGDPIDDTANSDSEIYLDPLVNNNTRYFKFGGGWFTLYSKALIDSIQFPIELEGYGALDNFFSMYCNVTQKPTQYIVRNLVITEDIKYTKPSLYNNYIAIINRRDDLYEKNNKIMHNHLSKIFKI